MADDDDDILATDKFLRNAIRPEKRTVLLPALEMANYLTSEEMPSAREAEIAWRAVASWVYPALDRFWVIAPAMVETEPAVARDVLSRHYAAASRCDSMTITQTVLRAVHPPELPASVVSWVDCIAADSSAWMDASWHGTDDDAPEVAEMFADRVAIRYGLRVESTDAYGQCVLGPGDSLDAGIDGEWDVITVRFSQPLPAALELARRGISHGLHL